MAVEKVCRDNRSIEEGALFPVTFQHQQKGFFDTSGYAPFLLEVAPLKSYMFWFNAPTAVSSSV